MTNDNPMTEIDNDDRGVSELLQFVLLLGIAISITLGAVWFGVGELSDFTETQSVQAATDEMTSLQDTQLQVAQDVPLRSDEITLSESRLGYGEPDEVHIEIEAVDPTGNTVTHQFDVQPVILDIHDRAVVLESGAVIYQSDSGSSMASGPYFDIAENRTTLTFFSTYKDGGATQVSGSDRDVDVVNYRSNQDAAHMDPVISGTDEKAIVTVTIETPRYRAWGNYFESHEHVSTVNVDESAEEVEVQFETYEVLAYEVHTAMQFD